MASPTLVLCPSETASYPAGKDPSDFDAPDRDAAPLQTAHLAVDHPDPTCADVARLVKDNLSLVGYLVSERLRKVPAHVNRDDLISAGMLALVLSAQAYEAGRGVPFPRFAAIRIRGALIDELRGMDWATRSVRGRAREMDAVRTQLTAKGGRSPAPAEVAMAMGISMAELDTMQSDLVRANLLSLQGFSTEILAGLKSEVADGPESLLLKREQLGYLHDAVTELPDRLRFVICAYFFEQRQMSDIAADLGVTESRVSQLCTEATALLRDGINFHLNPTAVDRRPRSRRATSTRDDYFNAIAVRSTVAGRLSMSSPNGDMLADTVIDDSPLSRTA